MASGSKSHGFAGTSTNWAQLYFLPCIATKKVTHLWRNIIEWLESNLDIGLGDMTSSGNNMWKEFQDIIGSVGGKKKWNDQASAFKYCFKFITLYSNDKIGTLQHTYTIWMLGLFLLCRSSIEQRDGQHRSDAEWLQVWLWIVAVENSTFPWLALLQSSRCTDFLRTWHLVYLTPPPRYTSRVFGHIPTSIPFLTWYFSFYSRATWAPHVFHAHNKNECMQNTVESLASWQSRDSICTVAPHESVGLLNRIEWHNAVEMESRHCPGMRDSTV